MRYWKKISMNGRRNLSLQMYRKNTRKKQMEEYHSRKKHLTCFMEYYHITAPATDGVFSSKEPSQEKDGQRRQRMEKIHG